MTEKLCLKWNDFQENINCALKNLRTEKNFTDVTLVCEDGQQVEVHKVILAASSPFFQKLLEKNKHPHPLVYMRALKFEDLLALVDLVRQICSKNILTLSWHLQKNYSSKA